MDPIICDGGGYAGSQYAASPYGGTVPCVNTLITPNPAQSNVEEFCRIITSCGD